MSFCAEGGVRRKGSVNLFPAEPTEERTHALREKEPATGSFGSPSAHKIKTLRLLPEGLYFGCGRRDLNPHDREATRTLILLVYQFQHFREQMVIYQR